MPRRLFIACTVIAALLSTIPPAAAQDAAILGSSLDGLLAAGRELNPALKASALETAAAAARTATASALEDPSFEVMRDGSFRETSFSVAQAFPLWGKRDLRRRAAEAMLEAARGQESGVALAFTEQLKIAYARYAAAHASLAVNTELARIASNMAKVAADRFAQGLGSQRDAIVAATEVPRAESEQASLRAQKRIAVAGLNALLARPPDAPLASPSGPRPLPAAEPPLQMLLDRALSANPLLRASGAEIRAASEERELADRAWYPDLRLGAGVVQRDNRSASYRAIIGVTIPLQWGAKRAAEQEAASKLGAARYRLADATAKLQGDLAEALAQLDAARSQISVYRNRLLPELTGAHDAALAAYGRNRGELSAVLESEHQLHQARLELLRIELEGQTALAALERLIGGDL